MTINREDKNNTPKRENTPKSPFFDKTQKPWDKDTANHKPTEKNLTYKSTLVIMSLKGHDDNRMKKKYLLKKRANANEFMALSGIESIIVENSQNCIVVAQKSHNGFTITQYAYYLYNTIVVGKGKRSLELNRKIHVSPTCGITNCVKKDHLSATYNPTKEDEDYIKAYRHIDDIEELAKRFQVPLPLFKQYLKALK